CKLKGVKRRRVSSTTTHSDISLSEYDSFIFDLLNDQCPPIDRSDFTHEEFADELAHIISSPEYDCFYFGNLLDPGEWISSLNSGIRENLSSTTRVNLPVEDDHLPLLVYVVWIFLAYLTYPVIPPLLHSFGNEDTIFDPGITINRFYSFKLGLSHRCGSVKKFNTHRSHLNECPMMINGKNTPILNVKERQEKEKIESKPDKKREAPRWGNDPGKLFATPDLLIRGEKMPLNEDLDWQNYLKYIHIDLKYVEEQRLNLLSKYTKIIFELNKCRDDLLVLKQAKLEAVTIQIQNTKLTKLNHALQDQLKEERKVNKKWLNRSNKVSQCTSEQIPNQKKKILRGKQLTNSSFKNDAKDNPFSHASLDYEHKMFLKSKDWVKRLNLDSKLPNFNTGRILVPESEAVIGKRSGLGTMKHTKPETQDFSNKIISGPVTVSNLEPFTSLVPTEVNTNDQESKINELTKLVQMLVDEKINSTQKPRELIYMSSQPESSKSIKSSKKSQDSKLNGKKPDAFKPDPLLHEMQESRSEVRDFRILKPKIPQRTEWKNRTLIEAARTMLNGLVLFMHFWTEAVRVACYTQNKSIIGKRHDRTPYDTFRERIPDISYFHVFRCPMFIHNHKDHLGKFDAKDDYGYFLGYSFNSKAFRVFKTRRTQIEETYHVKFDESIKAISSSVKTPMVPPNNLWPDLAGKPVNETLYRGMIGSLMYLKGTLSFSLYYPKCSGFDLKGYLDSDYVGCNMDRKITSCACQILRGKLMVRIFCDNTSSIAISNNPVLHSRTKHIDIRYHFIMDHIMKGDIELHFIPIEYQLADIFIKSLDEPTFIRPKAELGMLNID
nr:retrovirus-related Pol polyprotein from transposon TNT 1-94 [Tanacetum cinerariifolium]